MGYPSGHDNPGVAAITSALNEWAVALDDGSAEWRLPYSNYQRPYGRLWWTDEQLDTLVRDIDAEIDQEVTRLPGTQVGAKAGPGLQRLALPQRLALAQELEMLIEKHREDLGTYFPSPSQWPDGVP